MKTLPDNPNLDHLRQQAKDLLVGLRDAEPGTSLSQAQTSLARQYGFGTWTDLKAEVDRRHGQGDIADEALARELASRYGLGRVTGPMTSSARPDDMGRRWMLETVQGRWAVRTMDTWIPIVDADTDVALQHAAADAGIVLPAPVRSGGGAIMESVGGNTWRVNQWLPSGPPLSAPVSATVTRQVGEILATLHGLALPVDRVSPYHAVRLFQDRWPDLAATAMIRSTPWAEALSAAVPVLTELESVGSDVPEPSPVLSHNNLTPGNVRLARDGRLVVVSWEHAGGQPPGWELGTALTQWAIEPGGDVNAKGVRAMISGYRAVAGTLPPLEPAMFRGAVISLANYVWELIDAALSADGTDDRQHADRSVLHMLSHLPSRMRLDELLDVALAAEDG